MSHFEDNRPIPANLNQLFDELNIELFAGCLSAPRYGVRFGHLSKANGQLNFKCKREGHWGDRRLFDVDMTEIILLPGRSVRATRKTLVHEMAHMEEILTTRRGGHSPDFWRIMARCGYPRDHVFQDEQPAEADYYSGKTKVREQRKSNREILKAIGLFAGDRVVTPWGDATVREVRPKIRNQKAKIVIDLDQRVYSQGRFWQNGIVVHMDRCRPLMH